MGIFYNHGHAFWFQFLGGGVFPVGHFGFFTFGVLISPTDWPVFVRILLVPVVTLFNADETGVNNDAASQTAGRTPLKKRNIMHADNTLAILTIMIMTLECADRRDPSRLALWPRACQDEGGSVAKNLEFVESKIGGSRHPKPPILASLPATECVADGLARRVVMRRLSGNFPRRASPPTTR
jgi:hypothetical protein